jgi:hypothetical protein
MWVDFQALANHPKGKKLPEYFNPELQSHGFQQRRSDEGSEKLTIRATEILMKRLNAGVKLKTAPV